MGFIPDGGTYGYYEWSTELVGSAPGKRVTNPEAAQTTNLSVAHTVHVYFADAATPPAYFVIHHMDIEAAPGTALVDKREARGFFNSSVRVGYRKVPTTTSTGASVKRITSSPASGADEFDLVLDGPEIYMNATIGGGSGKVLYKPAYQLRNRIADWSLVAASNPPSWQFHQRSVWNALDVDGPVNGSNDVIVPARWIQQFFDGTPFGRISDMPKSSFSPVKSEMLTVWKVTGRYTEKSRSETLKLEIDYSHRVNLFNNATIGDNEPHRICGGASSNTEFKNLNLHDIALEPIKP